MTIFSKWLKNSSIPIHPVTEPVTLALKNLYAAHSSHITLVDNTKQRSIADPWVIAHALAEKANVVTKEEKVTQANAVRVKIPKVCENMGVRWLNDFQFAEEMNMQFTCIVK